MATQPLPPDDTEALVVVQSLAPANLFGSDPVDVIERAAAVATALGAVIDQRKLYKDIQGRKHVLVEGWTLLGSMLGVFPETEWTRQIEGGWEARVVAKTLNGQVVGAAEAMCTHSENTWRTRDEYALRSMAQTRAVSKALRLPLGFVMQMAGYDATPADEMPHTEGGARVSDRFAGGQRVVARPSSVSESPAPVARVTNPIRITREVAPPPAKEVEQPNPAEAAALILEGEVVEVKPKVVDENTALRNRALKTAEEIYRLRLKTSDKKRLLAAAQEAVDAWARREYHDKTFGELSAQGLESLIDALEKSYKELGGKLPL